MSYLLDTNVVGELRKAKSGRTDASVLAWADRRSAWELHLSSISVMEIELGVLLKSRKDPREGAALRRWLERILADYTRRILPVDVLVARRCATLHVPEPRPERDALIAATASVHGLTLVTRNVRDFEGAGLKVIDPWQVAMDSQGP